jgi:threonine dehydrogenase-like Zn-dependent dehydrogenase
MNIDSHQHFWRYTPGDHGRIDDSMAFDDPDFHRRGLTLLASRNATAADFHHFLDLVRTGNVDTRPWIPHRASAD